MTNYGHTSRHNRVRDIIIQTANTYGITCTKEPTCYPYPATKKRPDILFHADIGVATDVSIITPTEEVGKRLKECEKEKQKDHSVAVQSMQHIFTPAVFEIYGLMGESFITLINTLQRMIPAALQRDFRQEMRNNVSSALAAVRATAIHSAKWRQTGILKWT